MSGQTSFRAPSAGASSSSQMYLQPHQTGAAPNAIYANYPNYSHLYVETFKFFFFLPTFVFPIANFYEFQFLFYFCSILCKHLKFPSCFCLKEICKKNKLSVPKNVEPLPKFVNIFKSIFDDFKLIFVMENKIPRWCSYWLNIDFNNLVKE